MDDNYHAYISTIRQEGRDGYYCGFPNPYAPDTSEALAWDSGYWDAFHYCEGQAYDYEDA